MNDVRVEHANLFGEHFYRVFVNERPYDKFFSSTELTYSQLSDVARGYESGLEDYTGPSDVLDSYHYMW